VESDFLTPAKDMSNLPWFSLKPDPTHLKFRGEQTDVTEEEHTASQGQGCKVRPRFSEVIYYPRKRIWDHLKPAQHQSEVMTVRDLTPPIVCSTSTALLS